MYGEKKKFSLKEYFKTLTFWKVCKNIFIFIVIFIYGLFAVRICMSNDTATAKRFIWTADALEAYNSDPEGFTVLKLKEFNTSSLNNIFTLSNPRYVPSIGQFQFTLRFNDVVFRNLMEEYSLDALPEGELFTFAVRDNKGNYYTEYEYVSDERFMYNYRRLVFTGIDMTDVEQLTVCCYCVLDGEYRAANSCDTVLLYISTVEGDDMNVKKLLPADLTPTDGLLSGKAVFADADAGRSEAENNAEQNDAETGAGKTDSENTDENSPDTDSPGSEDDGN